MLPQTACLALVLSLAAPALAQTGHGGHTATPDTTGAAIMERMQADMAVPLTGNPDADFLAMMIPHHQGAIDMAREVIANGTDPEVRKLAQEVIAAQEAEILWMREWLAAHGY